MRIPFDSAYQKRPEFRSMDLQLQALHTEKRATTTGLLLPELRVGTYGSYFGDMFNTVNLTGEINAALIWKIPLGRLTHAWTIRQYKARITLQETQIAQTRARVNQEVLEAINQITTTKEQMEISLVGSKLAEQALGQSIARQQPGTVRPFEILQAHEVYIKLKLDYLNAVASYNKSQYAYYVATGNDL